MNLFEYICSLVFPEVCLGCGESGGLLCNNCLDKNKSPPSVESADGNLDEIVSFFRYQGVVKNLIKKFKYAYSRGAFSKLWSMMKWNVDLKYDCVVAVPISDERIRKRGFNQSEILARSISKISGGKFIRALSVEPHRVQARMNRIERQKNVKGIFRINRKIIDFSGKKVAIVDDVATTCSTLQECAGILKKNGATRVTAIVLARGW